MDEHLPQQKKPNNLRHLPAIVPKQKIPVGFANILKIHNPGQHNHKNVETSLETKRNLNAIPHRGDQAIQELY